MTVSNLAAQLRLFNARITEIQVWPLALQQGELKMLLACLPDLKHLDIQGGAISYDDFDSHKNLQSIHFHNCSGASDLKSTWDNYRSSPTLKTKFPSLSVIENTYLLDPYCKTGCMVAVKGTLEYPDGTHDWSRPKWPMTTVPKPYFPGSNSPTFHGPLIG